MGSPELALAVRFKSALPAVIDVVCPPGRWSAVCWVSSMMVSDWVHLSGRGISIISSLAGGDGDRASAVQGKGGTTERGDGAI